MSEQWKPWPRDPHYEVSDMGRVRTSRGVMKPQTHRRGNDGPLCLVIKARGTGRVRVKHMVWETWNGAIPQDGIGAVDGDHCNNRLDNLAAYEVAASVIPQGEVGGIVERYMAGASVAQMAQEYGVSGVALTNAMARDGFSLSDLRRRRMEDRAAERAAAHEAKVAAKYEALGRPKIRDMTDRERWEYGRKRLMRDYGITLKAFRAMVKAQSGKCALCGDPLPSWEFEDERVVDGTHPVVDHCHRSDGSHAVRGVLHAICNAACGLMRDDPERARRMARYLERTRHERPMRRSVRQQGLALP